MKTAAVYCRVSTDSQEREGTSLQTQMENCLTYCQSKGYNVSYRFSEAYSGLSMERPELDKLRDLARNEVIDVIVCYSLDRLTRDPVHGVIIIEELEKHHIKLEAVTEAIDSSEVGKLISYIRGFASKLEASKIRERTMRGKRARAKEGRVSGCYSNTFGYDYIPVSQKIGGGRRVINENEAKWVRQIYDWAVNEGMSTNAIRDKLLEVSAPTKMGRPWSRSAVLAVLKNPGYCGKTYAFTSLNHRVRQKPKEEWIELPGVTQAIVSQEMFDSAQKQLQVNRDRASRNVKREYLLRGHVRCRQCGRAFAGCARGGKMSDGSRRRFYQCGAKSREKSPLQRCGNKRWSADRLETLVWTGLKSYLSNRDLIVGELEKQREDANQMGVFESQLKDVERQLKATEREQHQLLQWALKGFPDDQVEAENKRLNKARETMRASKAELESQLKASQEAVVSIPKLEDFIRDMQDKLPLLDYEGKRMALDMLGVTVWLDGEHIEITGAMDTEGSIVTTLS